MLNHLSALAKQGIRQFFEDVHDDELAADALLVSVPEVWAWVWFQLREAADRPEWFPHGKWATLQVIEAALVYEARNLIGPQFAIKKAGP